MNVASMSPEVLTATANAAASLPSWFVVVMGMGIVFFGLICIVVLCTVMSAIVRSLEKTSAAEVSAAPVPAVPAEPEPIANRQELVAAISAVLAEELGKDVSAIRILSLKKV